MTSVNAEIYHREHDRKNEEHERAMELTTTSYAVAPWVNERDDRDEDVLLVDYSDDFEWKQTVRSYGAGIEGGFYVVDWEVKDYNGQRVWYDSAGFTVSKKLHAAIALLFSAGSGEPR